MRTLIILMGLLLLLHFLPTNEGFADAQVGDVVIILGSDLTDEQQAQIKKELGVKQGDIIITVSNAEEQQYLGNYLGTAQIGSKAISSAKITRTKAGSGLHVETNNITLVTEEMFENALITAGVKDADIVVTAPYEVSGTAALTGMIKAYEISMNEVIPEEQKQIANEEIVKNMQLGQRIGADKATALFTKIKDEIAKNPEITNDEIAAIIDRLSAELGIQLTDDEKQGLIDLFVKMKSIDIDWNQVKNDLLYLKEQLQQFLQDERTKNIFKNIIDGLIAFLNWLKNMMDVETST